MDIEINSNKYNIPDEFNWVDFTDPNFNKVFEEIILGQSNLFIQSRAGGGKSLLIKIASRMMKNTIILSTTGITAMALTTENITAYTIHSFLQINPTEILDRNSINKFFGKNRKLLEKAECIIIDEVSMMSNQLFDFVCDKIVAITRSLPRLILFGDVMQLPPVVSTENKIVKDFYDKNYQNKVMFFNSFWFKDENFKTLFLRKTFRQDDVDLADRILEVGYNDFAQDTLDYFNQRVMSINQYEKTHPEFMYISPVNSVVNKINNDYLATLTGKEMWYKAEISSDWPKNKQISDKEILIKEGAQIMCTNNHYPSEYDRNDVSSYRNGQIGLVKKVMSNGIVAEIDGKDTVIGKTIVHNNELVLGKHGSIETKSKGWYRQLDAKIARGITCHKSQGKSIQNVYFIPGGWLPEGLVYVALSRVTSLNGLGLSRPLTLSDIKVNKEAWDFLTN